MSISLTSGCNGNAFSGENEGGGVHEGVGVWGTCVGGKRKGTLWFEPKVNG
jgi:hypothetical protein